MLDLILTVCLAADPAACVERRVAMEACEAEGAARAEAWVAAHAGLTLEGWRCANAPVVEAPEEVAPGVFVHPGPVTVPEAGSDGDLANMALIVGDEAAAVVDTGGSRAMGEAWLAAVRAATDKPVRWLILTHMHPDHVLGAEPLVEAGAVPVGHHDLPRALAARAETYAANFERLLGAAAFAGTRVIVPGDVVEGVREIDLGGRVLRLEAHATAHTDNDLTVLDIETGTLVAGDLVFLEHTPALDGSITGWIGVLEDLAAREGIARVVPGHGPASAPWPEGAMPTLDYLRALAEETRAAIAAGEPMSTATRHIGEGLRGDWQLFEDFNARNATAAYKELEWE